MIHVTFSPYEHTHVLVKNAHLCINVGEMAAVDCESVWKLLFGRFPAELFSDPFLAHELLRFLRLNLDSLPLRVPQFTRSFPNLLKVNVSKRRRTFKCVEREVAREARSGSVNVGHTSFGSTLPAVLGVEQPGAAGGFRGSAAISGDGWYCR